MAAPLPQKAYTVQPVPPNYLTLTNPSTTDATQEKVLWIGCSDSLVSETDSLTNVRRSEIFVHRNLGNRVSVGDVSSGSALEWCIEGLKVRTWFGGWIRKSVIDAVDDVS
jgi:carbonic anhydrase